MMNQARQQIPAIRDYKKNCEVAEKLGHTVRKLKVRVCLLEETTDGVAAGVKYFNPCNDPRHYMPIAMKYKLNIIFTPCSGQVSVQANTTPEVQWSGHFPDNMVGHAVCEAFLNMEIDNNG